MQIVYSFVNKEYNLHNVSLSLWFSSQRSIVTCGPFTNMV